MNQVEDLMAKIVAEHSEPLHPDLVPYMEQVRANGKCCAIHLFIKCRSVQTVAPMLSMLTVKSS
jgi:hypothetical protein